MTLTKKIYNIKKITNKNINKNKKRHGGKMNQEEKKPINMVGKGVELQINRAFIASSAKKKCKTKTCLVLTGKILTGKLITGETIYLSLDGENLPLKNDIVARIEKQQIGIEYAVPGDEIGICLTNTRLSQLKAFL